MCLFLEPLIFGEAKSTDSRAMGFWTVASTHARTNFEKYVFRNPLLRTKSNKNGVGKNCRAFRLARTESIPAVYLLAPVGVTQKEKFRCREFHEKTKRVDRW